jgi:hypothetical protein
MTSMEFALRQAMSLQAAKRRAAGRKLRRQRGRQEQEDILSRTLAHKRK